MEILNKTFATLLATLMMVAVACASFAQADALQLYEKKIQSGLVYHFLKNTEWPESLLAEKDFPMVVCIYGDDPFEGYLDPMEGRTAQQRPIILRPVYKTRDISTCHAVIIGADKRSELKQVLASISHVPVLTMSNIDDFTQRGGMIEFGQKNNNIAVYVNSEAVKEANLKIHDRMMALAQTR